MVTKYTIFGEHFLQPLRDISFSRNINFELCLRNYMFAQNLHRH